MGRNYQLTRTKSLKAPWLTRGLPHFSVVRCWHGTTLGGHEPFVSRGVLRALTAEGLEVMMPAPDPAALPRVR